MTRLAHFVVALLLLPVAACGGDDYKPPPGGPPVVIDKDEQRRKREAKERKEAGDLLQQGDGYWYVRPKAWRNRTRAYLEIIPFLDDAISSREEVELFAELMFVTIVPAGPYLAEPLEDQKAEFGRHLRNLAHDVELHKLTTVDRKPAIHHSGLTKGGAYEGRLDQFVVLTNNKLYTITFKLEVARPAKARERFIDDILDTWHWED